MSCGERGGGRGGKEVELKRRGVRVMVTQVFFQPQTALVRMCTRLPDASAHIPGKQRHACARGWEGGREGEKGGHTQRERERERERVGWGG